MNGSQRNQLFGKLTGIITLLWLQIGAAQYVQLHARLEMVKWDNHGVHPETPWDVHCVVGTNMWRMDGLFLKDAKSTAWFTGTNLILSHELSKPVSANQQLLNREDENHKFVQVATASGQRWTRITKSADGNPGKPVRQSDVLSLYGRVTWLAYCSGPHIRREGRKIYPPSDLWKQVIMAPEGFTDRTSVFEDGLGLPNNMRLNAPKNFPVMQYSVVSSTNVGGWSFPAEFYLAQYGPSTVHGSNQVGPDGWEIDFIIRGRLIGIGPGAEPVIPSEVIAALNN